MKKLMKTMASAAVALLGFGAFAALPSPSATFEGLTTGEKTVSALVTNDDDGHSEGAKYWFAVTNDSQALGDVIGVVTNETGGNYFAMETSAPLYRTINSTTSQYGSAFNNAAEAETIGSDGIYLDTMVKFTPADEPFKDSDLDSGDKIAISYVENEETGVTNIVVRAGYVDGSTVTPTNYFLGLPGGATSLDTTKWYRLTVRTIANVGSSTAPVGFAIYLDEASDAPRSSVPLTYGNDVAAGDENYVGSLSGVAKAYLYTESVHALLPSLINSGDYKTTLTAVGFKGNGSIDDVSFTNAKPGFIKEGIPVEIAWDEGVATYTVRDSEDNILVDGAATGGTEGSTNLLLEVGITYLTVTATYGTGYEAGEWTVTGDGAAISDGTFTVAEGAKLNINSMTPKFDVGGTHYGSFDDALDAAAGADEASMGTIKLLVDVVGDNEVSDGWVTIDLAGKTITGVTDAAIINSGATLFITNSTAEIGHVAAGTAEEAVLLGGGDTFIYAGWFDGEVLDDGADSLVVYGGYYLDENAAEAVGDFYLYRDKYVDDGVNVTYYGENYFQVGESEQPPAPTTYELRIPAVTGASATVTDKATSSVIADLTAIEDGTVVTVTWTPESGYKITAGDTEEITMDGNQTATAPTVVAITYATLTITPVANCTIVVSNATEEVATGATFDVDDAVQLTVYRTPAEGYELDNCAATETITMDQDQTVTAAVKQSGGDYPSYIDDNVAYKDAYDQWKTENSVAAGDNQYVDAFLLNIAPDAADQTLEPASITMEGGKVVISANQTLTAVNGKVYVKVATTLAGLASAEWTEATLNEGKVQVTPGSSDTAGFYKIKVDF